MQDFKKLSDCAYVSYYDKLSCVTSINHGAEFIDNHYKATRTRFDMGSNYMIVIPSLYNRCDNIGMFGRYRGCLKSYKHRKLNLYELSMKDCIMYKLSEYKNDWRVDTDDEAENLKNILFKIKSYLRKKV